MPREILLYGTMHQYSASEFMQQLTDAGNKDIVVRINSDGGNPQDAFGPISKFKEYAGNKYVKVDGRANSTLLFFLCYVGAGQSEALDVSQFVLHRVSYGSYYEQSGNMTEADKLGLVTINDDLRRALEAKIDVKKFEKLKGVTLDQVFALDSRIDVMLTAKEALAIGLISKVVELTPETSAFISSKFHEMAANYIPVAPTPPKQNTTKNKMTRAELLAAHPELFAQVVAEGVTQERDRVGSFLPFMDADSAKAIEGIKSGKNITQTQMSEFMMAVYSKNQLATAEGQSAPPLDPKDKPKTEEEIKAETEAAKTAEFSAAVKSEMGL